MPETLALRHVAFEDLGLLAPILARRGHTVRYLDVPIASLDDVDPLAPDLLVVLGGPIGVYQNPKAAGVALEAWFVGHTGEIAATPGSSVPQLRADTARCSPALVRAGTACFEHWLENLSL